MAFFDKKEEVFHIELTPYGRYLLSIGKLKPHHYKFFDDDIVYDIAAMGTGSSGAAIRTELQTETHKRIAKETPKLKTNANVSGVETYASLMELQDTEAATTLDLPNRKTQQRDDNINFLQRELGTTAYNSISSPNYKVDLFEGTLMTGSTTKFLTSNNTQALHIPQINIDLQYTWKIDWADNYDDVSNEINQGDYYSAIFGDGKVFVVTPQNPIVRINEYSSFDEKENFEIKAWTVESGSNGMIYSSLMFPKQIENIVNGFLVDNDEAVLAAANVAHSLGNEDDDGTTPKEVEYYFGLNFDRKIPDEDLCRTVGELPIRNIFLDEPLPCPDAESYATMDIYATSVTEADIEDCD